MTCFPQNTIRQSFYMYLLLMSEQSEETLSNYPTMSMFLTQVLFTCELSVLTTNFQESVLVKLAAHHLPNIFYLARNFG